MKTLAGQLASQAATVVIASQDRAATHALAERIAASTGNPTVRGEHLDMTSLDSVRRFADKFKNTNSWLDGLINTGDMDKTKAVNTHDGHHWQIGVNFLGPFLLTELLMPLLKISAPARIVHTSCVFHERGELDLTDLDYRTRKNPGREAWCQSKLALALYARAQAKMLEGSGVSAFGVHIGCTQTKTLQFPHISLYRKLLKILKGSDGLITTWQSVQTTLHCLLDEESQYHAGEYFSQGSVFYRSRQHRSGGWPMTSPHPDMQDDQLGLMLYEKAAQLVNLRGVRDKAA
ncbi:SDR family NAD(P)-dependent oxidoreductase [Alphaproteobacteria bacterium LSUCC0684]